MGLIIPSIPYKSQYDDDASDFRNDCGPACVAMVLNALGGALSGLGTLVTLPFSLILLTLVYIDISGDQPSVGDQPV